MSNMSKQYGSGSFRAKLEQTFAGFVYVASAALCVGGTIAMLLNNAAIVV